MYADRVATGSKRSVRDRLFGNVEEDYGHSPQNSGKRQRQNDNTDKWKHDLYEEEEEPQVLNPKVGPKDLRLKLQRKGSQQTYQIGKVSSHGVRDLREKLSGTMHSQPANTDQPKAKSVSKAATTFKKSIPSMEASVSDIKKVVNSASSKKKIQQKGITSSNTVDGFLQSLGLEKYLITFQAEEIDMTALTHMTDKDLKTLGIPMGPRKKILLALDSRV